MASNDQICNHRPHEAGEMDRLVSELWQEASFSYLPPNAPGPLKENTQTLDNPHRLYVIHSALRRHGFQHLVEKYSYPNAFHVDDHTANHTQTDSYFNYELAVVLVTAPVHHALPVESASRADLLFENTILRAPEL